MVADQSDLHEPAARGWRPIVRAAQLQSFRRAGPRRGGRADLRDAGCMQPSQPRQGRNIRQCFLGQSRVLALPRGRAPTDGRRIQVVDYRHIIHSLRRKPMALLNLVYRDALFPRSAYRAAWERLLAQGNARAACRTMVGLLALAHDRSCEAALATALAGQLEDGGLPDLTTLRARFAPIATTVPDIVVSLPPIASYDVLLAGSAVGATA